MKPNVARVNLWFATYPKSLLKEKSERKRNRDIQQKSRYKVFKNVSCTVNPKTGKIPTQKIYEYKQNFIRGRFNLKKTDEVIIYRIEILDPGSPVNYDFDPKIH